MNTTRAIPFCTLLLFGFAAEADQSTLRCKENMWGEIECKSESEVRWVGKRDMWGDQVWATTDKELHSLEIRCREDMWNDTVCKVRRK